MVRRVRLGASSGTESRFEPPKGRPVPALHVAVDAHDLLADRRGIGVYLRRVLREWHELDACVVTALVRHPLPILLKRRVAQEIGMPDVRVASRVPRDADVAWHPWNGTFFSGAARNVATIHDVVPFAYPNPDLAKRANEQRPFGRSAQQSDAIVTGSLFSAREIGVHLGVDASRITVVPLGVDEAFSPGTPGMLPGGLQRDAYVLYVGTSEERKNADTAIAAWRQALQPRGIALAIVGRGIDAKGTTILRGVTPVELRDLYRGALAVVVPSTYEGFGLPALEALACGAPLVVSRAASLPEVAGDAALYVEQPTSRTQWAEALERVAADGALRERLRLAGPERARQFSWRRTAEATLRILKRVAES